MKIKREKWKHKYIYVARDDKQKILAKKDAGEGLTKAILERQFKKTQSFDEKVERRRMVKVYEVTDTSKKPYIASRGANYFITVKFTDGVIVSVKSPVIHNYSEIKGAKKRLEHILIAKIGKVYGDGIHYDDDIGEKIMEKIKIDYRREGIVRYANA